MQAFDLLKIALSNLRRKKARTILTVAGIVVGITAVIVVMSAGQGLRGFINGQLESFGSNIIEVEIKVPNVSQASTENASGIAMGINITTLKTKDAEEIAKHPNVLAVYSGVMGQEQLSYLDENRASLLFGVSEDFLKVDNTAVSDGRFFDKSENDSAAQVAVLGQEVANEFFPSRSPVGQSIKIGKNKFKVIGVMEERGAVFGMNMDDLVMLPVRTLQKKIMGIDYVSFIMAKGKDPKILSRTADDIYEIMREQHDVYEKDKEDFAVVTMEEAMGMMDTVMTGITILLIALASISLIVGGVGIMNIMYVSVVERIPEIGLRKAVGARNAHILWQFLWEAVVVTFVGGIIGIIVGVIISFAISLVAGYYGYNWPFSVSWSGVLLAVGFSIAIGLIFGISPARKAAKLAPVEALRNE